MKDYIPKHKTEIKRAILIFVFILLAGLSIRMSFTYLDKTQWIIINSTGGRFLAHALINIAPELAGIVIGVLTIDYLNERRQEEQLKSQLILQMASKHNDVTDTVVRQLRAKGWLTDGTLKGAELGWANLADADLQEANLENAKLYYSILDDSNLYQVNLNGGNLDNASLIKAKVFDAKLKNSSLDSANLEGAHLTDAEMQNALLFGANLINADLSRANLEGANLQSGNLENAVLIKTNLKGANLMSANLKNASFWEGYEEQPYYLRAVREGIISIDEIRDATLWHIYPKEAWEWAKDNLLQAESLAFAIMPDGRTYEEWIQEMHEDSND